ncbi:META domain-containing protein [Niabella beijingensis]|uniref:META domain-containing protein n=1 Tax=Niabella beijingensis TaxID=2872700 RepID=UPI001CC02EED|nr:META domain-containing protein [Niabella beijingensis]MBZ4192366.1 META domain-containing protein [Niabella beijingensis]
MKQLFTVLLAAGFLLTGCSKDKNVNQPVPLELKGNWAISYAKDVSALQFDVTRTAYPTISFKDRSGNASAGCNIIQFGVRAPGTGNDLILNNLSITNIACVNYAPTETGIMKNLELTQRFKIENRELKLFDGNGTILLKADRIYAID